VPALFSAVVLEATIVHDTQYMLNKYLLNSLFWMIPLCQLLCLYQLFQSFQNSLNIGFISSILAIMDLRF
jgi:hypothetical protein